MIIPKSTVPEGVSGHWSVERFTINKSQSAASLFSYGARAPSAGEYTCLKLGRAVIMSDTDAELRDHYEAVYRASGHCLINGLGLGLVLGGVLLKPEVTDVTIIEKSADVIKLVAPHFTDKRVHIVKACAFEYKPPKETRYGMVWHDIWPSICSDNLSEMAMLHRKYGRRADWQGSWSHCECKLAKLRRY